MKGFIRVVVGIQGGNGRVMDKFRERDQGVFTRQFRSDMAARSLRSKTHVSARARMTEEARQRSN
jgi:hypothetical protein